MRVEYETSFVKLLLAGLWKFMTWKLSYRLRGFRIAMHMTFCFYCCGWITEQQIGKFIIVIAHARFNVKQTVEMWN